MPSRTVIDDVTAVFCDAEQSGWNCDLLSDDEFADQDIPVDRVVFRPSMNMDEIVGNQSMGIQATDLDDVTCIINRATTSVDSVMVCRR